MGAPSPAGPWARVGLFTLPLYAVLLCFGTLTPQPDAGRDPEGWARFVSSTGYVVAHVLTNVIGAVLVVLGTFALGAFLLGGKGGKGGKAPRLALTGMVLSVAAQVLFMVPGTISTFATPAIGAAYLAGKRDVLTVEFPAAMTAVGVVALLLVLAGNVILGVAIWRSGVLPRWAGAMWAAAAVIFYLLGAALGMATVGASLPTQPVGAALLAVAGGWMAWSAVRGPARSRPAVSPPVG
jgi:hypothetical protein